MEAKDNENSVAYYLEPDTYECEKLPGQAARSRGNNRIVTKHTQVPVLDGNIYVLIHVSSCQELREHRYYKEMGEPAL